MLIGVIVFSSIHVTASNTKNLSFQHQPTRALPYGSTSTYKGPSLWINVNLQGPFPMDPLVLLH